MSEASKRGRPRLSAEERARRAELRRREQERRRAADEKARAESQAQAERIGRMVAETPQKRRAEIARELIEIRKRRTASATPQKRRIKTKTMEIMGPDGVRRAMAVHPSAKLSAGWEPHQKRAAEEFERDWMTATPPLRSPGLEPSFGGSLSAAAQRVVSQAEAGKRLAALKQVMGDEFNLVVAVVIYGQGSAAIHTEGGEPIVSITGRIKRALNVVAGFYGDPAARRDKTLEAAQRLIERAERQA